MSFDALSGPIVLNSYFEWCWEVSGLEVGSARNLYVPVLSLVLIDIIYR